MRAALDRLVADAVTDADGPGRAVALVRLAPTPLRRVGPRTFQVDVPVTVVLGTDHLVYSTDGARNLRFDRVR